MKWEGEEVGRCIRWDSRLQPECPINLREKIVVNLSKLIKFLFLSASSYAQIVDQVLIISVIVLSRKTEKNLGFENSSISKKNCCIINLSKNSDSACFFVL